MSFESIACDLTSSLLFASRTRMDPTPDASRRHPTAAAAAGYPAWSHFGALATHRQPSWMLSCVCVRVWACSDPKLNANINLKALKMQSIAPIANLIQNFSSAYVRKIC